MYLLLLLKNLLKCFESRFCYIKQGDLCHAQGETSDSAFYFFFNKIQYSYNSYNLDFINDYLFNIIEQI